MDIMQYVNSEEEVFEEDDCMGYEDEEFMVFEEDEGVEIGSPEAQHHNGRPDDPDDPVPEADGIEIGSFPEAPHDNERPHDSDDPDPDPEDDDDDDNDKVNLIFYFSK